MATIHDARRTSGPDAGPPVLTCTLCSRRLKAEGAKPGRVGKCPGCGGLFRVPEDWSPAAPAPPAPPEPEAVEEPPTPSPPANPPRARIRRRAIQPVEAVGRGGIFRLPKHVESGLPASLRYPLWDGYGLAYILFLSALLTFTSLVVFHLIPQVMAGGNMMVMGPFAFGMVLGHAVALGYAAQVLAEVIASSAAGEVHHPRWPIASAGSILATLLRWSVALLPGVLLGGWLAWSYAQRHEELSAFDRIAIAGMVASGSLYSGMALLAVVLFNDPLAANPLTVLRGIVRVGLSYLATCAFIVLAAMLCRAAIELTHKIENPFLFLGVTWLVLVLQIYAALVVARLLGLCHYRHAKRLGWFPERLRWGAS